MINLVKSLNLEGEVRMLRGEESMREVNLDL